MPPKIPGVWGLAPDESCIHHERTKGIQKCFLNQQLTKVKTVAQTCKCSVAQATAERNVIQEAIVEMRSTARRQSGGEPGNRGAPLKTRRAASHKSPVWYRSA